METQLHAKIRKKYRTVKAVGPERTDERTYGRTNESEFIGSFRSLGEPISLNNKNYQKMANFGLKWPKISHIRIFLAYKG